MYRFGTSLAFGLCEYPFVDPGEEGTQPSFTEQGGVLSATVLPEVAEVHHPVFAYGLLFGWLPMNPRLGLFCVKIAPFYSMLNP